MKKRGFNAQVSMKKRRLAPQVSMKKNGVLTRNYNEKRRFTETVKERRKHDKNLTRNCGNAALSIRIFEHFHGMLALIVIVFVAFFVPPPLALS